MFQMILVALVAAAGHCERMKSNRMSRPDRRRGGGVDGGCGVVVRCVGRKVEKSGAERV